MSESIYYINGRFVSEQDANVSAIDLAVLRGYGVFDTLRTYGGRPFHFRDHLNRLKHSADLVGIELPWDQGEITAAVETVLGASPFPETSLRILITGGVSGNFFTPDGKPSLIIIGTQLVPYAEEHYTKGIAVATDHLERFMPAAKTTNYMPGQVAMQQAKKKDPAVFEVIYVDRSGNTTEGVTSNIFAVVDGVLITPAEGVLQGITRTVVLEVARDALPVKLRALSLKAFISAEEAFITGSKKEVMPIASIDGQPLPEPVPGPVTRRIMGLFREYVQAFVEQPVEV